MKSISTSSIRSMKLSMMWYMGMTMLSTIITICSMYATKILCMCFVAVNTVDSSSAIISIVLSIWMVIGGGCVFTHVIPIATITTTVYLPAIIRIVALTTVFILHIATMQGCIIMPFITEHSAYGVGDTNIIITMAGTAMVRRNICM